MIISVFEDYEYCEDYSFYSDEVLKDICESIIPLDYKNTKCIFNNGECLSEKNYAIIIIQI